jgi:hypothetical protein
MIGKVCVIMPSCLAPPESVTAALIEGAFLGLVKTNGASIYLSRIERRGNPSWQDYENLHTYMEKNWWCRLGTAGETALPVMADQSLAPLLLLAMQDVRVPEPAPVQA